MPERKPWSALIRQIRAASHWSQDELAERMQTDQTTISRWERDLVTPGPAARRKLDSLAKELGLKSLAGVELMVRASPFPMILVNRAMLVVAASASSGFNVAYRAGTNASRRAPAPSKFSAITRTTGLLGEALRRTRRILRIRLRAGPRDRRSRSGSHPCWQRYLRLGAKTPLMAGDPLSIA